MRFKDDGIVIRHLDWSETSQLVVVLTAEHGKRRGLAKGSRRLSPSSVQRFSGGLELLTRGQLIAHARRGEGLGNITEWDLRNDHGHLRRSLPAWRAAMVAADATHHLLADDDPHPATFAALGAFLPALRDAPDPAPPLLAFLWSLLIDAGYRPRLDADIETNAELPDAERYRFDPAAGGFTLSPGPPRWGVRRGTLAALRAADAGQPTDPADAARATRLLLTYAQHLLDRPLPTLALLGNAS